MVSPWLRFHIPLIEPDRQISRIRLSDKNSRFRVQRLLQFLTIYHCCPVKRGLFCKLGLLHKGFWGVYFGGTLSAVWASGGNFLPDFIFESGRYHVRRPNPLFTGHGFCSVDEFRSHCPEVWWRRARPNASLHGTFPRYGICASNVSRESARHRSLSWSAAVKIVQHGVARADCKINIG